MNNENKAMSALKGAVRMGAMQAMRRKTTQKKIKKIESPKSADKIVEEDQLGLKESETRQLSSSGSEKSEKLSDNEKSAETGVKEITSETGIVKPSINAD